MFERIMGLHVIDDLEYQRYREAMQPILIRHAIASKTVISMHEKPKTR